MSLWSPRTRPSALTAAASPGRSAAIAGNVGARPGTMDPVPGHAAMAWQWDIWGHYDLSGPLKFAGMYRGNMYRRVRLQIGVRPADDPDGIPIPADDILDPDKPDIVAPPGVPRDLIEQAQVELGRIRGKFGKQQILYDLGVNLTIAGDCRLAVIPDPRQPLGERWEIYSVIELRQAGVWPDGTPRWTVLGPPTETLPPGSVVWRMFNPHPARHSMADSSAMGVINDLEELKWIGQQFRGLAKSRIPAAGVFVFAKELGLGKPADPEKPDGPTKFMADMVRHTSSALKNEDAATNMLPHFVEGPADLVKPDSMRHITFDRPADALFNEREKASLGRLAIGLDTPPEVILGLGDVNHWTGAQVSEDSWKAHGEPGMILICSQLADGPVRTMLTGAATLDPATGGQFVDAYGVASTRWTAQQVAQIVVIHDPTDVIDRPDRGQDAKDLHKEIVISDAALRAANNFSDADAPSTEEVDERVERERLIHSRGAELQAIPPGYVAGPPVPGGSTIPNVAPATDTGRPGGTSPATTRPPAQAPPTTRPTAPVRAAMTPPARPVAGSQVGRRLADLDLALYNRIQGAANAALRRNLERAGGRITSKAGRSRQVGDIARSAPRHLVASRLGRDLVASLGIADDDVAADYTDLLDQVDTQTARTRRQGLTALMAAAARSGRPMTSAQLTEYQQRTSRHAEAGRTILGAALSALTLTRLYDPGTDGEIVGDGEGYDAASVPPGIIRGALAVYGGQDLGPDGQVDGGPVRGVAGGADNLDAAAGLGIRTDTWQWIHGDPLNPFEPHEELDGEIFGDDAITDSERLSNSDNAWIGSTMYYPGDHDGCTCFALPILVLPDGSFV